MICTDCPQRDVCDLAGKDDPLLTGCDASHGTWAFDRLRLDRMTADRDALRAELERTKEVLEIARAELTHQRDGYDHEPDEHAHGGSCRACKSEAALEKMDAASAAIERKDGA